MNPILRSLILSVTIAAATLSARAQVMLTLGQSSISNTFVGSVSVTISGLLNGETVILERFRDANENGVVDAGDVLQSYAALTDGVVTSIGGVRNEIVAGDDDLTVNGTVRTTFAYRGASQFPSFVGGYLVRVSSPTARFAPVTQPFTVTQTPFSQTVSGVVTNGAFAAVAVLGNSQDGDPVGGTYANAAGNYTIKVPVGSYPVVSVKPGFVAGAPGLVTLNTNDSAVVNLSVIAGGPTLSGRLTDVSSGAGLPAVQMFLNDTNGTFTLAFTDSNGNFSAPVTPGSWRVDAEGDGVSVLGYVRPFTMSQTNYNTTTGSVANINFTFQKANALVYGYLRDPQSNGLPRVEIRVSNSSSETSMDTFTNGYFSFGVSAGANLNVTADDYDLSLLGFFAVSTNLSVGTNQAVQVTIPVRPVTARLVGQVVDNNGEPVPNMPLAVQTSPVAPGNFSFYPFTDANGNFNIGLYGGAWNVALECVQAGNQNLVSFSKDFNIVDGVNQSNIVLTAFYTTRTISAQVRTTNNSPITNLRVFANATINGTNYVAPCVTTDGNGNAALKVLNGNWTVSLDGFGLNAMGFAAATNQIVNIAGANGSVTFVVPRLTEVRPNINPPGIVSGFFNVTVVGASGGNYQLESSTNLTAWAPVATYTATGGSFNASVPMGGDRFRYFRITLVQGGGGQ